MSREYPCVYYKNGTCTEDSEPGYVSPCVMGPCSKETPIVHDLTNDDGFCDKWERRMNRNGHT